VYGGKASGGGAAPGAKACADTVNAVAAIAANKKFRLRVMIAVRPFSGSEMLPAGDAGAKKHVHSTVRAPHGGVIIGCGEK
jgi:hypothetical protein